MQIAFVDPTTTPDAALCPTATITSEEDSAMAYSVFNFTGGQFLGVSLTGLGNIEYSDPERMVVYPATYLTGWTDAFAANFSLGGFPVVRTGTITAEVDGYGTRIMPYGTLTDVLRVTYVEDHADVRFGTTNVHQGSTYFLQAGTHYPVFDIHSMTITPAFGPSTIVEGTHWLVVGPGSSDLMHVPAASCNVYPVPAGYQLNVEITGSGIAGPTTLDLLDASGRIVAQRALGNISQARHTIGSTGADKKWECTCSGPRSVTRLWSEMSWWTSPAASGITGTSTG